MKQKTYAKHGFVIGSVAFFLWATVFGTVAINGNITFLEMLQMPNPGIDPVAQATIDRSPNFATILYLIAIAAVSTIFGGIAAVIGYMFKVKS